MLAAAPKEKVEKVGKSAGAAGVAIEHAAPAAEAALGASAYFGVLRVAGALTSASRRAKESATRTFCRKHAFPAVAAAASPHVVVAAAAHCADVAAKVTTAAAAREAFAALVAALERPTPAPSDEMDEEETEEAWRVTREAASWAARAVVSEAPCAEEAFGPVAVLAPFDDYDQVLKTVNDSRFGLQAGIFTRDLYRAQQAWDEMDVGGVVLGDVPSYRVDNMPYGGVKDSGIGREGIVFAMEDMTEIRNLVIRRG